MRGVTPPQVTATCLIPRRFFLPTRPRYDTRYRRLSTCRRLFHEQTCLSSLHTPHTPHSFFFRTAKGRAKTARTPHTLVRQHTRSTHSCETAHTHHTLVWLLTHALVQDRMHSTHSCETAHTHHTLVWPLTHAFRTHFTAHSSIARVPPRRHIYSLYQRCSICCLSSI
jgi:hypothetical protein